MTSLPPEIARARALLRDIAPPQGSKQRVYARVMARPSPRQSLQARLAIVASQAELIPIATNAAEPLRPLGSSASSEQSSLARPDALESASALSQQVADYRDAVSQLRDNPAIALSALQAHRAKWPNSAIAHEVDLRVIEALVALGRHADAVTAARRFLQRYPESARANEIRRIADANPSVGTIVD